jgi:hypothetical protein
MTTANWTVHPNFAVWILEGTRFTVFAPQYAKTFVVERLNRINNRVPVKRGFRKLATAKAYAEALSAQDTPYTPPA